MFSQCGMFHEPYGGIDSSLILTSTSGIIEVIHMHQPPIYFVLHSSLQAGCDSAFLGGHVGRD